MSIDDGLRPLIERGLPMVDWQAIESGLTGLGIPDLNGCCRGVEFWIECKATSAWRPAVRTEQIMWAERRARHGGRVFVAVRRRHSGGPKKGPAVDELWLYRGEHIRHVATEGIGVWEELPHWPAPLLVERGGSTHWSWDRVLATLLTTAPLRAGRAR